MTCKICNKGFIPGDNIARVVVGKILNSFDESIEFDADHLDFDAHFECVQNSIKNKPVETVRVSDFAFVNPVEEEQKDTETSSVERTNALGFLA